jgi:putative FmdB family regulatory protein
MPIYEYECTHCGHIKEALQKMSEDPLVDCPKCLTPSLKKIMSAVAFRLKGGGWYETDFKSGQKKNLTEAAGSATEGKSSDSGNTAESVSVSEKPAASEKTNTAEKKSTNDSGAASAS